MNDEIKDDKIGRVTLPFTSSQYQEIKAIVNTLPTRQSIRDILSQVLYKLFKQKDAREKIIKLLKEGEPNQSKWHLPF